MRIELKNIGVFKQAEYELGDFTIICGMNNSGKTYATYTLFGFFDYWKEGYQIEINDSILETVLENGTANISLIDFIDNAAYIIDDACKKYKKYINKMLGAREKYFENASFSIKIQKSEIEILGNYQSRIRSANNEILQIIKEFNNYELSISLLIEKKEVDTISFRNNLKRIISDAIKEIIFYKIIPNSFIASAERTGAAIFKNDLNIEKNKLIEEISSSNEIIVGRLANKLYDYTYALPVKRNLDFIRRLESISKFESYISIDFPDILDDFGNIVGGDYKVDREGLNFIPKKTRGIKLSMGESSSSVRSLLDIGFYLKHIAQKNDLLMIDEPELNLHPENQRKLARLLSRLVNIGIKVFITTHSDYIIKELNTLIMLNYKKDKDTIKDLLIKNNYKYSELISYDKIKVFIACNMPTKINGNVRKISLPTLIKADIDEFYGIQAESFDKTIDEMNKIQKSIIFER
jgi:predicted ATPase